MTYQIRSRRDIHLFLDLLYGYDLMPDPWTDFHLYVNLRSGQRTVSDPMADQLNGIMKACMKWCEVRDIDIAELIHAHFWDNWAVRFGYHELITHCELDEDYFELRMAA